MKGKTFLVTAVALAVLAGTVFGCSAPAPSATQPSQPAKSAEDTSPIVVGVPLPLTGNTAETGRHLLTGIEFAVKEAMDRGGVLGRRIELRVEDTKGEINTAAAAAEKLLTSDKVFALVGGYGSTVDYGMLQSVQSYDPLFIHAGSSTVKLEETFGNMSGYFHVFIWDYHRQKAITKFLTSLQPKPEKVAIIYEDGLYGKTSADFAQVYFKEAGLSVVVCEAFKSGSPDFSGILGKVKSANPDVLYWVGYSNDNIQIARQAKTLQVKPKLMVFVGSGNIRKDFGDAGEGVAYLDTWSKKGKVPGLDDWLKRFQEYKPGQVPVCTNAQGYAAMDILLKGIEKAGALDKEKVTAQIETMRFWTPFGELPFRPSEKARHQMLNEDTMVIVQYRGDDEEVVWPSAIQSAPIKYPAGY